MGESITKTRPIDCSIIIPNLNSPMIDRTIVSILSQKTNRSFEIIVIGVDEPGLLSQFPTIQFLDTKDPVGAAEARNIGIKKAKGEWLLFIDADCVALQGWIETFFETFSKGWNIVGGGITTPTDDFWMYVYNISMFHEQLYSQNRGIHKYFPTINLAVNKKVIDDVGYLNESLMRGQDIEWTSRMSQAGYKIFFEPSATIEHFPPRKDFDAIRNYFYRSGYYMIKVRQDLPKIFNNPRMLFKSRNMKFFSPMIAFFTTIKIILNTKEIQNNLKLIPYIYKLKAAWCAGAVDRLRRIEQTNELS